MRDTSVERLADAVMHEGYNLYPYRPSALKNRHRWLFGCVLPRSYCDTRDDGERWAIQTQCLLVGDPSSRIECRVRFLHPYWRIAGRLTRADDRQARTAKTGDGQVCHYRPADVIDVGGEQYSTWQDAEERAVTGIYPIGTLSESPVELPVEATADNVADILRTKDGRAAGVVVSERHPLHARIRMACQRCLESESLYRVTVRVENHTTIQQAESVSRDEALLSSPVSLHTILHVRDGEFVSSIDPPPTFHAAAAACENTGMWPVLVGDVRRPTTILAAPIALGDFPQIAAESPGDLFDGGEIDELLSLRIQTLTDSEKREAASAGERTRQLLQRTDSLGSDQLERMHGAMRTMSPSGASAFRPGDRVRLRPRRRADAFDLILAGRTAVITAVERDFEDNLHLAVTIEDDPGKDLGACGMPGHRFFFHPDEVELIEETR